MEEIKRTGAGRERSGDFNLRNIRQSINRSTRAMYETRIDRAEDQLDEIRDRFGKATSDVIHMIISTLPEDSDLEIRTNEQNNRAGRRQSTRPYPGRHQRNPGKLRRRFN